MTANYQPYPGYEESGVEWVGEVPTGWEVQPFFVHASQCKRSNKGMVNDNLLSLSFGRVIRKNIETSEGLLPASFETYQIIEQDDVVFRLTDLQNDKRSLRSAICREHGIITSAYLAAQPASIEPSYLAYLMRSYDTTKVFYALGSGLRQSLKYADMKRLPLLIPSRKEQIQIAKFLDYETAKIDALIEKQQQLIALLKEKRQAVISHAVTKGLNPDAPMRDSGIEWLGEVPAHWEVLPLRHALQVSNGQVDPRISPYSVMPLVAPNHIESGTGRLLALESAEEQGAISGKYEVREGDVIYSKIRPALRKVTVAPQACLCSADMYALRPTRGGDPAFFSWLLLSEYFSGIVVLESMRVAMPKVNRETLAPIPLPVPDPAEQRAIAGHLSTQTSRLDALVDKATASMELLQERRTALISAAVTGKIDVRGWKAPDSEPEAEVA